MEMIMDGRYLFDREYVGYTGSLTHIAMGIDRLAGEAEVGDWIRVDGVWDAFVEQVLRPIQKLELAARGIQENEEGDENENDDNEDEDDDDNGDVWGSGEEEKETLSLLNRGKPKQPVMEIMKETRREPVVEKRKGGTES